jgi:3',5'-cyclic AMP phosphodiesterase CpdA
MFSLTAGALLVTWSVNASVDRNDRPTGVLQGVALEERLTPGSSLVAVLPDTQIYSLKYPGILTLQAAFIAARAKALDIRSVLHLGDIVHENTPTEWRRARKALQILDGTVPLIVAPGNHDYGPGGNAATRDTPLNQHFPFATAAAQPGFGGAFAPGKLDNSYHLLTAGGRNYVVLALEWGPRDEVITWASEIMTAHPDRWGILVTHAYLDEHDRRQDHTVPSRHEPHNPHAYGTPGPMNDGEEIWQKLVRHHRFVLTVSGHVLGDGTGYLVSRTDRGNLCHQMLVNFQTRAFGGEGLMRLLEFLPDAKTVRVHTYTPLYEAFLDGPDHAFAIELPGN